MVQIVGDHTQADPSLHSGIAPVDATAKSMPALEDADPALATGPPLLSLFEPALLLFALPLGASYGAIRNAHALDTSLVRGRFVPGGVEGRVARHQAGSTAQRFLMRIDGGITSAESQGCFSWTS